MRERDSLGKFIIGHTKIGGFIAGDRHDAEAKKKVSNSLVGKVGKSARRWRGIDASYEAKHMWIIEHWGKAVRCTIDNRHRAKRYEWHNITGEYKRDVMDYAQLCPSCHRKLHLRNISWEDRRCVL